MALSRVGGSSAAATSIAIPAHVAGDLIVIWAYRDGSTTPPTVPAAAGTVPAFTTVDGPTGANANAAVCAWAVAAGTTDTSGTWTNATGISVEVWRGQSSVPIGGHAQSGASVSSGGNLAVPAITLQDSSGNSAILAFAGWQTVTAWSAAPSGYTQRSSVSTEVEALTKNSTTTDGTFNVSGTASGAGGTRTQQLEILADLGNRLSQETVEVLAGESDALARLSQETVEALLVIPVTGNRVSQIVVEALIRDVVDSPFIASATSVHAPTLTGQEAVPFIASVTTVNPPALSHVSTGVAVPFIPSATVVYDIQVSATDVEVPFIDTNTNVYRPTLRVAFTGAGVSQVAFEVTTSDDTAPANVTQVTLEIVVPQYKGLHVWQRS